jgi:hypothetical protein
MKRREFIAALGGAAMLARSARAQQAERIRRIGVLMPYTKDNPEDQQRVAAFQNGLKRSGWIEGRNIQSEYRWYAGDPDRARSSAKELVDLKPDVILVGASPGLVALRQETHSPPDIRSCNRSGGPRSGPEPGATGRQRHRLYFFRVLSRHQAPGIASTDRAACEADRNHV